MDLYEQTGNDAYLASARNIWNFIESGCDSILGGGVYWCEQKKESKNTEPKRENVPFDLPGAEYSGQSPAAWQ